MRISGSHPQLPDRNTQVDRNRQPADNTQAPQNKRADARFDLPEKASTLPSKRVSGGQASEPVVYDVIRAANAVSTATGMSGAQASDIRGELVGRMSTAYARQALAEYEENQNIEARETREQAARILGKVDLLACFFC